MKTGVHMKLKRNPQKFTKIKLIDVKNRQQCEVLRNGPEALLFLSVINLLQWMFTETAMCLVVRV
jgi:hypothetical protein